MRTHNYNYHPEAGEGKGASLKSSHSSINNSAFEPYCDPSAYPGTCKLDFAGAPYRIFLQTHFHSTGVKLIPFNSSLRGFSFQLTIDLAPKTHNSPFSLLDHPHPTIRPLLSRLSANREITARGDGVPESMALSY